MTHHLTEQITEIYERYALEWDVDRNSRGWNDKRWHDRFVTCLSPGATTSTLDVGQEGQSHAISCNVDIVSSASFI